MARRRNNPYETEAGLRLAIEDFLSQQIKNQLMVYYVSRAYDGRPKPIGGGPAHVGPKIFSGELLNSVEVYFDTDFDTGDPELVVDFGSADYWYYVNYGRQGKQQNPALRYPPIEVGRNIASKGGAYPGLTIEQTGYLINRSIGEYGIYGINFIESAWQRAKQKVEEKFGLYGALWVENQINKLTAVWGTDTADKGSFVISLELE